MYPPYLTEKPIKSFFNNKFWNNDTSTKYNFNKKFSSYYKLSYTGDIFVRTRKKIDEFRSSHRRYSVKKVFLQISQNSQENTCASVSFLIKLLALGVTQVISCEFREILRIPFLQNTSGRLLLWVVLKNFTKHGHQYCFISIFCSCLKTDYLMHWNLLFSTNLIV